MLSLIRFCDTFRDASAESGPASGSYGGFGAAVQSVAVVALALAFAVARLDAGTRPRRGAADASRGAAVRRRCGAAGANRGLGDSLAAGYGLPADAAFPARLEQALKAKGVAVEIANAGVSGDTASGGLARLDWSVPEGTDAVILELGANDMLRGIDPKVTRAGARGDRAAARRAADRRPARRHAGGAQSRARLRARLRGDLCRPCGQERPAALSFLPRRRRRRGQAQSARWNASHRCRRRRDRQRASCPRSKSWSPACARRKRADQRAAQRRRASSASQLMDERVEIDRNLAPICRI